MQKNKYPEPCSRESIDSYALWLRDMLEVGDQALFKIIAAVENGLPEKLPGFSLEVETRAKLRDVEAFTEFDPARMTVREDVYEGAFYGEVRSRYTIAHELGHLCLHWGYPRPRLAPRKQKNTLTDQNSRMETEANKFAGAFLMPTFLVHKYSDPKRLSRNCGVSEKAASIRIHEVLFLAGNGISAPNSAHKFFDFLKAPK